MSSTDYLRLNEHKIFQNLRETLPKDIKKTKNVLCVRDDVLYTWNFQDNCVLALNVKAARSRNGDNIIHQTLLPMSAPYFEPESIVVNSTNTLLAAFGPNGVLIFVLPERSPPYGLFSNSKEVIYCRSYSLHERALAFSTRVEVRQARFHPGSPKDTHITFLTSDNILRIYNIQESGVVCEGVFGVGVQPTGTVSTSKISLLETLGETAVDFDFGPPERAPPVKPQLPQNLNDNRSLNLYTSDITKNALNKSFDKLHIEPKKSSGIRWPMYFLYGNGEIYTMTITIGDKCHPGLKGPHIISPHPDGKYTSDLCSLLCIPSTPPILCIGSCKGKIYHVVVLPSEIEYGEERVKTADDLPYLRHPEKSLYLLESIELELGLSTTHVEVDYCCPIYLHRDIAKLGNYFATHETGVHAINIPSVDVLHKFLNSTEDEEVLYDLVQESSSAEYLLCTKTSTSDAVNPIIGFSIYYDPHSFLGLLSNGHLVSVAIVTMSLPEDISENEDMEAMTSPLKNMLVNPFDAQIMRILKQSSNQPILKLSNGKEKTQQECYELLQRAAQVFREEHFKHHDRAREEIEKRVKSLRMLKDFQMSEIERMTSEKQELQEKAESIAEKYEDFKEKQEKLTDRCQKLLIMISKRQSVPSNAEKKYHQQLEDFKGKIERYASAIDKLKNKLKYQEVQMANFEKYSNSLPKVPGIGSAQSESIKANLQDMTNKIADMVKEVNEYKKKLNIL